MWKKYERRHGSGAIKHDQGIPVSLLLTFQQQMLVTSGRGSGLDPSDTLGPIPVPDVFFHCT